MNETTGVGTRTVDNTRTILLYLHRPRAPDSLLPPICTKGKTFSKFALIQVKLLFAIKVLPFHTALQRKAISETKINDEDFI